MGLKNLALGLNRTTCCHCTLFSPVACGFARQMLDMSLAFHSCLAKYLMVNDPLAQYNTNEETQIG